MRLFDDSRIDDRFIIDQQNFKDKNPALHFFNNGSFELLFLCHVLGFHSLLGVARILLYITLRREVQRKVQFRIEDRERLGAKARRFTSTWLTDAYSHLITSMDLFTSLAKGTGDSRLAEGVFPGGLVEPAP